VKGHGAERTDRRRAHDDLDHAKEDLCHPIDDGVDPLAKLSETRDGEAGEDQNQQDLQQACSELVKTARDCGGDDNITCLLVRIVDRPWYQKILGKLFFGGPQWQNSI